LVSSQTDQPDRDADPFISRYVESQRKSKAQDLSEIIKEGIFRGRWKPGDRINDRELAELLKVSRISIREALSKLVESKVLVKIHWKGYRVRTLSWREVESIVEIRSHLESLVLDKVIGRLKPETIEELRSSLEETKTRIESLDYYGYRKSDFRFHEILYETSENEWLKDILINLRLLTDNVRRLHEPKDFREFAERGVVEHGQILEHLRENRRGEAQSSMQSHMRNHLERVRQLFGSAG
jgi:DNA-binding GntR family transcriptional regulator